jgi:DNA-binding SARP family transcriptional activator
MLLALAGGDDSPDEVMLQCRPGDTWVWSLIAEEIAANMNRLSPAAREVVEREAALRPERWASALRLAIAANTDASDDAASLLAIIGSSDDARFLRSAALTTKALRPTATRILQRMAPHVMLHDLGVVDVHLGQRSVKRSLRRRVLALLCFLASRPGMASSRDETLEALWPDLGASAGSNSLHQAIYFLRRVFEPDYREGMTAEYVHFDGEVLSLNASLVSTTSSQCWMLIRRPEDRDGHAVDELMDAYKGTFALDFAYEEWAADYRDSLHAAVLAVVEADVKRARATGDFERTIRVAQALLLVDPTADAIELELILAYKASGRRSAAAEQYAHYAAFVREELGSEPASIDELDRTEGDPTLRT